MVLGNGREVEMFHYQTKAVKEQMSLLCIVPPPPSTFQGDLVAHV